MLQHARRKLVIAQIIAKVTSLDFDASRTIGREANNTRLDLIMVHGIAGPHSRIRWRTTTLLDICQDIGDYRR